MESAVGSSKMPEAKITTMKLFIDKNSNKVVYAEAGKDCVDFLLHILVMPLGLAMRQVFNGTIAGGSLGNLYRSVADDLISADYLLAKSETKDCLLDLTPKDHNRTFYRCSSGCTPQYVSDFEGTFCPCCMFRMKSKMAYFAPCFEKRGEGYVKGKITYVITDDLVVKPLVSTRSSIMLLNVLNVKDVGSIEESEVTLDSNQGMALLNASLVSNTVLTDTFLDKKMKLRPKKQKTK